MFLSFLLLSSLANADEPTVVVDQAIIDSLSFDVGARQALFPENSHSCGQFDVQKMNLDEGSSLLCTFIGVGTVCTTVNPAVTYWGDGAWSPKYPKVVMTKGRGTVQELLTAQKARLDACLAHGLTPSDTSIIDGMRFTEFILP